MLGKSPSLSLLLTLFALLALATTHPLWLHLADAVPADIGDPLLNTWILAWDIHALLTDPLHLFDANIFYPLPRTLAYSEHLFSTAALILPLGLLSGEPVLAYNLSLLLSFPLAGLGMYLLVLHWTRRRGAAFLAGIAFAFAPYRMAAISHLQLLTIQWLPFSLLALDRLLKSRISPACQLGQANLKPQIPNRPDYPSRAGKSRISNHWLPFVVFTTMQVLASWYLAVFTGLVLGLYVLGWWLARLRHGDGRLVLPRLARLAGPMLVVAALTFPFALPYWDVLPQLRAARPTSLAASFAARPTDFLTAAPYLRLVGPVTQRLAERPGFTEENALFLGVVAPLLALVGLALTRPRWRIATLAATLVASLLLTFAGPYRALTQLLPALSVVRVPPRWIILATFALAALAGQGAAWLGDGRQTAGRVRQKTTLHPRSAVYGILLVLLIAESFAAPLPLAGVGARADLAPVYYALQGKALRELGGWGVVELPMHVAPAPEFPETKRLYASTLGWWGLVNGYSGFTPERQMALDRALADFPDAKALAALRELGASGVRYLIVHPGEAPLDRARWEATDRWQAERVSSLLPVGRFGSDDLYLINPYGDSLITNPGVVADRYWSAQAPTPVHVRFTLPTSDGEIRLLAYVYQPGDRALGDWKVGRLTLYWWASNEFNADYTVFVHSLDAEGVLIGQADGPPVADRYPTTAWRPGEIVQDSHPVPPGDHYLVGLYDPTSSKRLPAFTPDGTRLADDAVVLVAN